MTTPSSEESLPFPPTSGHQDKTWTVARRALLGGLLATSTLAVITWAAPTPSPTPERGAFIALSSLLVGRQTLDPGQAARLFDALLQDDPAFSQKTAGLLSFINARLIAPLELQRLLDAENSPFATLPRIIVTAWCLGIVGTGDKARCLAFETALNAIIVADVLRPPTYAYGGYGSWAAPPRTVSTQAAGSIGKLPGSHAERITHG
ncbi:MULTISPECIES: sugar dehydrogenase complex small subunit [unclassified Novosphingobium]|uniref:sugar dehydrogenase complex small subunit n=1 Tax=unclassified Novosphingobium TaxID=2644732 RepID=UPI0013598ED5|nr:MULTISPECIES: sugar dehydrogenase complex small subunit [unclassified Novosphingobium]